MKTVFNFPGALFASIVCLCVFTCAQARLGEEDQMLPVARRLPHFRTWDDDYYFYSYGCDNDGKLVMKGEDDGEGDEVLVEWRSERGEGCSNVAGDVKLKRGTFQASIHEADIYFSNDSADFLLGGKVVDENGDESSIVLFGEEGETSDRRRRKLEDGLPLFDIHVYFGGVLELDTRQDLLMVKSEADGTVMDEPDYSFQAVGDI